MEKDTMTIPYTPIVINTGSKLVVIDTGLGRGKLRAAARAPAASSQPISKAAGIDPRHGRHRHHLALPRRPHQRPDQAGQLARLSQRRNLVPAVEWKYFMDDGEMSRQTTRPHEGRVRGRAHGVRMRSKRKVTQYDAGKEVAPGITAVATPRPHAGPHVLRRRLGGKKVYVQADVTNHPALFARNPGWHAFFDQDPQMAEADPPQGLRHAGGGEDDGAGLPLSVPGSPMSRRPAPAIGKFR